MLGAREFSASPNVSDVASWAKVSANWHIFFKSTSGSWHLVQLRNRAEYDPIEQELGRPGVLDYMPFVVHHTDQ